MDINSLVYSDAAIQVIDGGAWVSNLPGFDGMRLKVRGMQSEPTRKAMEAKQVAQRAKNKGEAITAEQHATITKEVLGETVLLDWDGFTNDGKPFAYDAEFAKKAITSRNGEKLANLVLYAAQRIDADAQSFVEVAAKN